MRHPRLVFRLARLSTAVLATLGPALPASAAAPAFNLQFLQGATQQTDLNDFLQNAGMLPGSYRVDLLVNGVPAARRGVVFERDPATQKVAPCFSWQDLQEMGVDPDKLAIQAVAQGVDIQARCVDLPRLIPEYRFDYESTRLLLTISIPQAYMPSRTRRDVDRSLWESGATVAFSNYSVNAQRNWYSALATSSGYLGLRNGVNIGHWRLRNDANVTYSQGQGTTFRSYRVFAQTDIDRWNSQATIGQTFTDGQIFDSVRIRGMELRTDESMLPLDQRGYSPAVRGVAETQATVEIRQNGYLLTTVPVAPGPFVIDDFYASGSNGELEVTIVEADGRRRISRQPFGALPIMLRAGAWRYSAAMGRYDAGGDDADRPWVATGTLSWGVSDSFTAYGGVQTSRNFHAANLGAGVGTAIGAVSGDVTQSRSVLPHRTASGRSVRLLYSKTFTRTNTNFTLAGYRYSSEGYRTLQNHIVEAQLAARGTTDTYARTRNSFNLSIYQSLGSRMGSVFLSANTQDFWNVSGRRRSIQMGYGNTWGRVSYNVAVSHTNDEYQSRIDGSDARRVSDRRIMLTLSMPLGSGARAPFLHSNVSTGGTQATSLSAGVSGSLPGMQQASYSVYANKAGTSRSASASMSASFPAAHVSASYSQGNGYRSANVNLDGSAVIHAGGVNLGPTVGETFGLAHVPDAAGVQVDGGGTTGSNGYAIVPYLSPYARNVVSIDTSQAGSGVEIAQTSQHTVPRRGAVTILAFKSSIGRRVQFELTTLEGTPLPLGASIEDAAGRQIGVTDTRGRALLLVPAETGSLQARWNRNVCTADYALPAREAGKSFDRVKLVCRPGGHQLRAAR